MFITLHEHRFWDSYQMFGSCYEQSLNSLAILYTCTLYVHVTLGMSQVMRAPQVAWFWTSQGARDTLWPLKSWKLVKYYLENCLAKMACVHGLFVTFILACTCVNVELCYVGFMHLFSRIWLTYSLPARLTFGVLGWLCSSVSQERGHSSMEILLLP